MHEEIRVYANVEVVDDDLVELLAYSFLERVAAQLTEILGEGVLSADREDRLVEVSVGVEVFCESRQALEGGAVGAGAELIPELGSEYPYYQLVFIVKVVVEALSAHIALVTYLADADFFEILLGEQLFQRLRQSLFRFYRFCQGRTSKCGMDQSIILDFAQVK